MNAPAEGEADDAAKNSRPLRVPAGGDLPPLPRAADVIEIVLRMRPPGAEGPTVAVSVTDQTQIGMFLGQLGGVDWKQEGEPLDQISLIAPDMQLLVYEKSGIHRDYALYWGEDSFVDNVTNRLLDADVKHLRLLVVDALIRQLAAERAKPAPPAKPAPDGGAAEDALKKKSRQLKVPSDGEVPPHPAAADVSEVLVRVRPPSGGDEPMVAVSVTDRAQIATILAQLGGIDWKQEGQELTRAQIFAPDIELTIYKKTGIHREYGLYWEENSFVDGVTLRLLEADMKHLRLLVIEALIRKLAAEQAKPVAPTYGAARLDTTSDEALAGSLTRMTETLSPQQQDDVRQVLEWYENPYSNPNFDGVLTDESWLDQPRHKKLAPFDGLTLVPLLKKIAAEPPASGRGTKPWSRLSPLLGDVASRLRSEFYFKQRRRYEPLMREQFIAKGGRPKRIVPLYAILGESEIWARLRPASIRIPLSELPASSVSFTYTDSYYSYVDRDLRGNPIPRKPQYETVYRLDELCSLFERWYWSGDRWKAEPDWAYDVYVEVQVWDDEPLRPFLTSCETDGCLPVSPG